MREYLRVLDKILAKGEERGDRTGTGTLSIFGERLEFDLQAGFPLVTTKKIHTRSAFGEMLWFLRGYTNVRWLHQHGITIWDEWANEVGDLGPIYGAQWRRWWDGTQYYDQIGRLLHTLKNNPTDRRMVVSAWNVGDLDMMRLPPCHYAFQCYSRAVQLNAVTTIRRLDLMMHIRSWDFFLGGPFNIAQYALLTHLLAHATGHWPGRLIITGGDVHLYRNHLEQAKLQLGREPRNRPRLHLHHDPNVPLDQVELSDIEIMDYHPHAHIAGEVSV